MYNIILDLGYDVKIISKQTWEMMGKPKLIWSHIQLRLANQHNIALIGRLIGVNVNINGVCKTTDFEVIEIVDGINPYQKLLGINWDFDNHTIIDLKKETNDL